MLHKNYVCLAAIELDETGFTLNSEDGAPCPNPHKGNKDTCASANLQKCETKLGWEICHILSVRINVTLMEGPN